jgi:tRNA G10  N-methylase Trm11
MLPPKLARMMVNLAQIPHDGTVLDPFCGGGTVLMEGALATNALHLIGSDNDAKQISDTLANNAWLVEQKVLRPEDAGRLRAFLSDVKRVSQHLAPASVDRIVTEGFLGPPLRGHETAVMLDKNAREITELWIDTLTALRPILKPRGRIVTIWPAFKSDHGMARVDLTIHLNRLGYHPVDPLGNWESSKGPLIYQRPDQRVSRRIVVLE